jgi:hypothetical protein
MSSPYWWENCGQIARLLSYLNEGDDGPLDMTDAIYLVEKPWKWDDDYQAMCREQDGPGVARANARLAEGEDLSEQLEMSLQVVRSHRAGGGR